MNRLKTNKGLVEYAKAQLGKPYWYGTFGNTATPALLNAKKKQYPAHYQDYRTDKYRAEFGERVHDCVGLIKGYLWSENADTLPKYDSSQDVSANGMYGKCIKKGNISTMPDIPGILVFMSGHVGVYIGDGNVIEARGFNYGVVQTQLNGRGWTHWGKCPWIDYPKGERFFKTCRPDETSIVDALKSIGENSGFAYRKKIAAANGITGYVGTAKENIRLLSLLRMGELVKPI